jgi:glycosyltransferase involved in cell wall biosynthesis
MPNPSCVVVILTFNSIGIIKETVEQALQITDAVYVIDSGSQDGTIEALTKIGCTVLHRDFINYSEQRNWGIEQFKNVRWQLHLDADEVLDDCAIMEIRGIISSPTPLFDAYMIQRIDYFMGQKLKHSGLNPWHLRLFQSNSAICENRLYDQHFVSQSPAGRLKGCMHDKNHLTLSDWINRHNRWSDLEAQELLTPLDQSKVTLTPQLMGDPRQRMRALKHLYYQMPGGVRAFFYFLYRYFLRLGFLDGKAGLYFAFFQAYWFRMLVDAKIYEKSKH